MERKKERNKQTNKQTKKSKWKRKENNNIVKKSMKIKRGTAENKKENDAIKMKMIQEYIKKNAIDKRNTKNKVEMKELKIKWLIYWLG